ncbi:M57 family metalloprotease [Pedobacter suwonensis]|uniref:M57 family metalloprotease n=1 Tax=Pedobacter suwonensis TaxID=332999 RepID=UPI0011A0CB33|nr:M57 family metalloprotease [Pedobacter suwonensis]
MKKTSIFSAFSRTMCLAFLLLTLSIYSCKKSESPVITTDSKAEVASATIAKIKEMGLSTDGIKESGDYYIVEGDILISKVSLSSSKTTVRPQNTGGKISQANTNNLIQGNLTNVIITTEDYDTRWFYAIRDAVTAWNSIGNCRINLIHSYSQFYPPYASSVTPNITVKKQNLGTGAFGQGQFPTSSGTPGATLLVNPYTNNVNSNGQDNGIPRSHAQDVYMLVHEIGHCLGLRHTDWAAEGTGGSAVGANPIPGTPNNGAPSNDPNSVMNSGRLGTSNNWSAFSSYDVIAAQYLYPPVTTPFVSTFKNLINGLSSVSTGSTVISTAGAMYDGGYYEWRMLNQSLAVVLPTSSFSNAAQQEWSYSTPGTYYLECRLVGLECAGEWARQTITFN